VTWCEVTVTQLEKTHATPYPSIIEKRHHSRLTSSKWP
jgi:hypothetical protein